MKDTGLSPNVYKPFHDRLLLLRNGIEESVFIFDSEPISLVPSCVSVSRIRCDVTCPHVDETGILFTLPLSQNVP